MWVSGVTTGHLERHVLAAGAIATGGAIARAALGRQQGSRRRRQRQFSHVSDSVAGWAMMLTQTAPRFARWFRPLSEGPRQPVSAPPRARRGVGAAAGEYDLAVSAPLPPP